MEIEIKIRLASEDETARLEAALGTPMLAAEDQENVFFDGKHRELIGNKLVFRIRVIQKSGKDPIAVVALKGNAVLIDGIATVEEEEELIDVDLARRIIDNPDLIVEAASSHKLLRKIVDRVPCPDGYSHMGRFRNIRHKYKWLDYTVEIDRTLYPHGTAYEAEIESTDPELAKARLSSLMKEHSIPFGNSQRNKFENMLMGTVL
ncbi:hypothetical protein EMPS_01206 [Entomortierella parvispora]|uniref:CYTH domain-containing protein n=1 Tax=Entomortierella parvispora TaxID=205924 RepID=A0A9P3LSQ8_9FUNG|nr:hypothetical protein EMPS_01206 [Entomortierella parvispora]